MTPSQNSTTSIGYLEDSSAGVLAKSFTEQWDQPVSELSVETFGVEQHRTSPTQDVLSKLRSLDWVSRTAQFPTNVEEIVALKKVITESRWILRLEDDWDGEGAVAYSEDTWKRAVRFLLENTLRIKAMTKVWLPVPRIQPGPHGSIDLKWQMYKRKLLVNIPADRERFGSYYGVDKGEEGADEIGGKRLDVLANNARILMWLME